MATATCTETRRVLVVEDDPAIREGLVELCEDEGLLADSASNGREAVERLGRGPCPGVILLDAWMPVMNGWEFLTWLRRQQHPLADVPVFVVSADNAAREAALDLGAAGYLEKPIPMERLLDILHRHAGDPEHGEGGSPWRPRP